MPGVDPAAGIHGLLGVEMLETTPERVVLRLPVDWKVHQPYGILHGGVSALLAESAASLGAALAAGPGKGVVGIELNASHLRSLRDGHLTATATPIRVGRTIQVWGITLTDDDGRAICECTLHRLGHRRTAPRRRRCGAGPGGHLAVVEFEIVETPGSGLLCRCDPGRKWSGRPETRADPPPHHAGRTRRYRR